MSVAWYSFYEYFANYGAFLFSIIGGAVAATAAQPKL